MIQRDKILDDAKALITGERAIGYGTAFDNFNDIARGWSVILNKQVTREDVALCMAWVKIARLIKSPDHMDSWTDLAGYAALGGEIGSIDASNKLAMSRKTPEE